MRSFHHVHYSSDSPTLCVLVGYTQKETHVLRVSTSNLRFGLFGAQKACV